MTQTGTHEDLRILGSTTLRCTVKQPCFVSCAVYDMKILSTTTVTQKGSKLLRIQHASSSTNTDMIFALFLPHNTTNKCLFYLSGLTCTDQNCSQKAATMYPVAESRNLAICLPDTSPRGEQVANDSNYDLGQGAGFYVNSVKEPWSPHFQMKKYVTSELPALLKEHYSLDRLSVTGHSMGGHGALTLGLYDDQFVSVSAFSPICHPTACPWGKKAFAAYLGDDEAVWKEHDATELLLAKGKSSKPDVLIDQGLDDEFLASQLCLDDLDKAAAQVGQKVTIRRHEGMDHSYYFIAACIVDHINFHADAMA